MSKINLPPLPEPRIVSQQTDSTMRSMELRTYDEFDMRTFAEQAVREALAAQVPVAWLYHDGKPGVLPDPRDLCTSMLVTISRQPWCRNETALAIIPYLA